MNPITKHSLTTLLQESYEENQKLKDAMSVLLDICMRCYPSLNFDNYIKLIEGDDSEKM